MRSEIAGRNCNDTLYQRFNGPNTGGLRLSASVFAAYDSVVGPLALGAGLGEGGNYAVYLFLGRP